MKRILIYTAFVAVFSLNTLALPIPTLQPIPASGNLAGTPGSVLGWGLALNFASTSDWVVLNDSFFTGSQVYGSYKDYVANQFVVAGPAPESATVSVPFSLGASGLGEFDINSTAFIGTAITGNITVDYSVFSQDPNSPNFDPNSFLGSGQVSAPVRVSIVPEPGTFALLLLAAGLMRKQSRR